MFQDIEYKLQWLNKHPESDKLKLMCEDLRAMTHTGVALDIAYASVRHSSFRHCVQLLSTLVETLGGFVDQLSLLRLMEVTDTYIERPDTRVPGFFEAVLVEASCAYDQRHLILDLGVGASVVQHLTRVAQKGGVDGFEDLMDKLAQDMSQSPWALDLRRIGWFVPDSDERVLDALMAIGSKQNHDISEELWKWLSLGQLVFGARSDPHLTLRGYNLSAAYYACHNPLSGRDLHRLHPCWQAAHVKFATDLQLDEWFSRNVPMHPLAFGQCTERHQNLSDVFFNYAADRLRKGATADVRMQAAKILTSMPDPFHDRVREVLVKAANDPVPKVKDLLQGLCVKMGVVSDSEFSEKT